MWDFSYFNFNPSHNHTKKHHHHQQNLLPIQIPVENDDVPSHNLFPLASFRMILVSLLSRCNNNFKYLILALFSPLLLPLICAAFPFLCALEVFFRLCCRRWRWRRRRRKRRTEEVCGGDGRIPVEEGGNEERLLQRYLEDQLILVAGSLYESGDDDDEEEEIVGVDVEFFDSKSPRCN